jgi:hypothetical protein
VSHERERFLPMRHWKKREEDDERTSLISESSVLESHNC